MYILGKLKERVELQKLTQTTNSLNEVADSWTTITTRWASVEYLSAKEQEIANQLNAIISYKVVIRKYPSLRHNWQILWDNKSLGVENIVDKDDFYEIYCSVKEEKEAEIISQSTAGGASVSGEASNA